MIEKELFMQVVRKYYWIKDELDELFQDNFIGGAEDCGDIAFLWWDCQGYAYALRDMEDTLSSIMRGCKKCESLEQAVQNWIHKNKFDADKSCERLESLKNVSLTKRKIKNALKKDGLYETLCGYHCDPTDDFYDRFGDDDIGSVMEDYHVACDCIKDVAMEMLLDEIVSYERNYQK